MNDCPKCASSAVVKFGSRTLSRAELIGGVKAETSITVQRFQCRSCNHAFHNGPKGIDPILEREVVDLAFKDSVTAAAEALQCDERFVRSVVRSRNDAMEHLVPATVPGVLGFHVVDVGGAERIMLTDLQNECLVDILADRDSIPTWVAERDDCTEIAAIAIDPRLAGMLPTLLPAAEAIVPVSVAAAAMESAAAASLRGIVREGVARGRNFRERQDLLDKPDDALDADDRDELPMWSRPAIVLRRCLLHLLDGLQRLDEKSFAGLMTACRKALDQNLPGSPMATLLSNWAAPFVAGVRERWMDEPFRAAAAIAARIKDLRPRIGLDTLRGALVLSRIAATALTPRPAGMAPSRDTGRGFGEVQDAMDMHWTSGSA